MNLSETFFISATIYLSILSFFVFLIIPRQANCHIHSHFGSSRLIHYSKGKASPIKAIQQHAYTFSFAFRLVKYNDFLVHFMYDH